MLEFKEIIIAILACIFTVVGVMAIVDYSKRIAATQIKEAAESAKIIIDFLVGLYGTCKKQNDLNLFHNIVLRLGEKYKINVTKAEIAFHVMEAELKRSKEKQFSEHEKMQETGLIIEDQSNGK